MIRGLRRITNNKLTYRLYGEIGELLWNFLDEIFNDTETGLEEERKPDIEKARNSSYISHGRFFVSLDADAIEELNHKTAEQHVGVIGDNAYFEVSTAGWYIVCWQDGDTQWEYDPGTGETRHCGCGADCIWTDWE